MRTTPTRPSRLLPTLASGLALAPLAAALGLALGPGRASADEASGTWTGHVEARGNYYYERSTRVVAPRFGARLESPGGTRIDADYLVDTITSASVAAGVAEDFAFTEVRHELGAQLSHPFDVGGGELRLGVSGRLSLEPDYQSYVAGVTAELALADRASVFDLSLSWGHDDVSRSVRRPGPNGRVIEMERRCNDDTTIDCGLELLFGGLSLTQTLSRTVQLTVAYNLAVLRGFQWNPYRMVPVQGVPTPEHHPDGRFRNEVSARLVWHLPGTRTTFHLMPRGYVDSWDLRAVSTEVRVYQELAPLLLRARYRFYAQSDAEFYRPAAEYPMGATFITLDGKMRAFRAHTFGGYAELELSFLEGTVLGFARRATLDLQLDYTIQNSVFGNAAQAQIGGRIPF